MQQIELFNIDLWRASENIPMSQSIQGLSPVS